MSNTSRWVHPDSEGANTKFGTRDKSGLTGYKPVRRFNHDMPANTGTSADYGSCILHTNT